MKRITLILLAILSAATTTAQTNPTPATPPRVGLVLGGGGAKGAAHIGVLKYMEEIGIPIHYVAGTSMGSIIGGLYALGYSPDQLADLIAHMDWSFYMSNKIDREHLTIDQRQAKGTQLLQIPFNIGDIRSASSNIVGSLPAGAINSSNLLNLFNRLCIGYQDSMSFDNMPIPFACVATDLLSGDSVVLRNGEFGKAIRSSMSIPGVFEPVRWGNRLLADGGMVNNFPVDVCINMGADIIIGIEVASQPIREMDSLGSLPQQMMQYLSIATMGHNADNRAKCSIYIRPDVTGYNMLSFSTENIDTLVQRGYRQAQLHREELLALKAALEQYGECHKTLQNPPARKLMPADKVLLGSVTYHGVPSDEARQLSLHGMLTPSTVVTVADIENTVNRLRGTGYYENITYKLHQRPVDSLALLQAHNILDATPVYDIDFHLTSAKPHSIGLGFRYDTKESAEILFHFGFNQYRATGFRFLMDIDMAYNFEANLRAAWSKAGLGLWNFDYRYHRTILDLDYQMCRIWQHRARLYYSRNLRFFTLQTGLQQSIFIDAQMRNIVLELSDLYTGNTPYKESDFGLFLNLMYDNRDDPFFANRGNMFNIHADIFKYNSELFKIDTLPFASLQVRWQSVFPLGNRFTFIPQIDSRIILGNYTSSQPWNYNVLGGVVSGCYFDQQMAVAGEISAFSQKDFASVIRADLRYQLTKKQYLSLMNNIYTTVSQYTESYQPGEEHDVVRTPVYYGLGLRYAYRSLIGPLHFDILYNTRTNRVTFFLNVGHYF